MVTRSDFRGRCFSFPGLACAHRPCTRGRGDSERSQNVTKLEASARTRHPPAEHHNQPAGTDSAMVFEIVTIHGEQARHLRRVQARALAAALAWLADTPPPAADPL